MTFLEEIKRRKVFRVALIYAVTAWLLVQVVVTVEEPLGLPGWVDTFVIILLVVGFPVALILSWLFNLTPHGLVRESGEPVTEPAVRAPETATARARLPNSIAVLPFENLSPNPADAYFAAGMHEQLLNELAKVRDISVIARTSVLRYANDPPPVPQIAEALNVGTVMEGSVRYSGQKVRVTAQLIDGMSGAHLWTEAYDGDLTDIFAIQTKIATAIARSLEGELLPETRARLEKPPTDSPAAYALYLQGSNNMMSMHPHEAVVLFDRAIELDPKFALAYARRGLAKAGMLANIAVIAPSDPREVRHLEQSAIADADRALEIDGSLGVAWHVRGTVNQMCWRWASADRDFARALELSPNDPSILGGAAMFLADKGDSDRAMWLARKLIELDPTSASSNANMVMVGQMCGHHGDALAAAARLKEIVPAHPSPFAFEGHVYLRAGDRKAAVADYRIAEDLMTDANLHFLPAIIYGYGVAGRREEAQRLFQRYQKWAETHPAGAAGWQFAYLGIGDADTACEWLARMVGEVERCEPDAGFMAFLVLKNNLQRDPVLEQPRFRKIFDRIDALARSR